MSHSWFHWKGSNPMTNRNLVGEPVEIMDREVEPLKQSRIPIVKVRWNSRRGPEFTWEREDQMRLKYSHLFTKSISETNTSWIQGLNSFLGGRLSQLTILGHLLKFDNLLFINHYSSKHYSSFFRSVWYSEKRSKILLFTKHYSFPERKHYSCALLILS